MDKMFKIVEQMEDEAEGALQYAECACKYEQENEHDMARQYRSMADAEIHHWESLQEMLDKRAQRKGDETGKKMAEWATERSRKNIEKAKHKLDRRKV